jgi:hypothetical protein
MPRSHLTKIARKRSRTRKGERRGGTDPVRQSPLSLTHSRATCNTLTHSCVVCNTLTHSELSLTSGLIAVRVQASQQIKGMSPEDLAKQTGALSLAAICCVKRRCGSCDRDARAHISEVDHRCTTCPYDVGVLMFVMFVTTMVQKKRKRSCATDPRRPETTWCRAPMR